MFWPESDDGQARHALRQVLHFLKKSLPANVWAVRDEGLLLDVTALDCDALEFERALEAGDHARALALYNGELVPGFYVSDASQFERWLDEYRARLRRRAAEAAWGLATDEETALRAFAITPDDEEALCRLLVMLEPAAALRAYEEFAARLAADDDEPAPETRVLVERIRAQPVAVPLVPPAAVPAPVRRRRRWAPIAVAAAAVVSMGALMIQRTPGHVAAARRLYELGLHAAARADRRMAARFFHEALAADPTFAVAAYRAAASEEAFDLLASQRDLERASALVTRERVSEHDALMIRQAWAATTNDPRALSLADSFAARFPRDADAQYALGTALTWSGDFLGAVPHLRRAIALVSTDAASCGACRAYGALIGAYRSADSAAAAERTAREWTVRYPRDAQAWFSLAWVAEYTEHYAMALAADRTGIALAPAENDEVIARARIGIRAGEFAEADRLLDERARDGAPEVRLDALWWLTLSLRTQGRLSAARTAAERWARENAAIADSMFRNGARTPPALAVAQVDLELGRTADAVAGFDAILREGSTEPGTLLRRAPALVARHRTWNGVHLATGLAAAGDTARLAALADSLERWGSIEGYGRDRRLHHYARGLLLAARSDTSAAIAEFERSIDSPTEGYTRASFEAARLLLRVGRARDAVAVLQPTLRGNLEASNYYVTRTELHDVLAHAWLAAGGPDSAAAHFRYVATAWGDGDPAFRQRALEALGYLRGVPQSHFPAAFPSSVANVPD
jgi:tetratricopeptide (TPR) repeat protein